MANIIFGTLDLALGPRTQKYWTDIKIVWWVGRWEWETDQLFCLLHKESPLTWSGFSLCLFCTMEYIIDQAEFLPPIQFSTFWVLKIFAKREQVKLLHPNKGYFHSPLYGFWLTMTSLHIIYSIVRKGEIWARIAIMETTAHVVLKVKIPSKLHWKQSKNLVW